MRMVRAKDVRSVVVETAKAELEAAAGPNGLISRAEQATLEPFLREQVEAARVPGRAVHVADAVAAVTDAVDRALSRVNTAGPHWLSLAETQRVAPPALQARLWQARAAVVTPAALPDGQLAQSAASYIALHVEAEAGARTGKALPALESGDRGLQAHLVSGPAAARLAALAHEWKGIDDFGNPLPPAFPGFDPDKTSLFVVRTTQFDNERLFVHAIDRASGAVRPPAREMQLGEIFHRIDEPTFVRLVGPLTSFGATRYDFASLDYKLLSPALLAGSLDIDIQNPLRSVSPARVAQLETEVRQVIAAAGFPGATVHVAGEALDRQEALPGAVVSAVEAVRRGLESYLTVGADPESPLGILVERVREERHEPANQPSAATIAEARRRLEGFLNRPTTHLRLLNLEEEPEGGPTVRDRWAFEARIDDLSATIHWAIVDRKDIAPTYNYGFN